MSGKPRDSRAYRTRFGTDLSNTVHNPLQHLSLPEYKGKGTFSKKDHSFDGESTPRSVHATPVFGAENFSPTYFKGSLKNDHTFRSIKDTTNDADDEKESSSLYSDNSNVPGEALLITPKAECKPVPAEYTSNYAEVIQQLQNQLLLTKAEANKNRELVLTLERQIEKMRLIIQDLENQEMVKEEEKNVAGVFSSKLTDIKNINASYSDTLAEIQNNFDKVQSIQCKVYQTKLQSLEQQIKYKDDELQQMSTDFATLQNWTMSLFKEIGDRSRSWSNLEFKLTTQKVAQKITPPLKKSNLENIYRYVLQFLYADEELSQLQDGSS